MAMEGKKSPWRRRYFSMLLATTLLGCATGNPLSDAADRGDVHAVQALLDSGSDVNATDQWGAMTFTDTPLMHAARNGHSAVVIVLVNNGADVNAKNNSGQSALMIAAASGHRDIVQLLLAKGADPRQLSMVAFGDTPEAPGADVQSNPSIRIWRVTDVSSGTYYFARSIELHWHGAAGPLAVGEGTVTILPTQRQGDVLAHLDSGSAWTESMSPAGTTAKWEGSVRGFQAFTAQGLEPVPLPAGKGFGSIMFEDLKSGKHVVIAKFSAEVITAGDVPGLLHN